MKATLIGLNAVAMLMLTAMSDLEGRLRVVAGIALAVNLLLLVGRNAIATRPARWGAVASLWGYAGTVGSWLVLALGCGIEYYNATCSAIVTPLVAIALGIGIGAVPVGRVGGLFSRRRGQ